MLSSKDIIVISGSYTEDIDSLCANTGLFSLRHLGIYIFSDPWGSWKHSPIDTKEEHEHTKGTAFPQVGN